MKATSAAERITLTVLLLLGAMPFMCLAALYAALLLSGVIAEIWMKPKENRPR